MLCLNHHGNSARVEGLHERVCHLESKVFLDLQSARKYVHNACHLGKTDDFSIWNVGNVRPADKREQVMFAQGIKFNILDQYNLARIGIEKRIVDDFLETLPVAIG